MEPGEHAGHNNKMPTGGQLVSWEGWMHYHIPLTHPFRGHELL